MLGLRVGAEAWSVNMEGGVSWPYIWSGPACQFHFHSLLLIPGAPKRVKHTRTHARCFHLQHTLTGCKASMASAADVPADMGDPPLSPPTPTGGSTTMGTRTTFPLLLSLPLHCCCLCHWFSSTWLSCSTDANPVGKGDHSREVFTGT
jgi:hypothetical protein